ncbi:hypothetical protein BB560_000032 [Smittium megazygosporum]|uniref:NEDD8-conjugating enzyme UBC12 n=1 Tax=Smittium megazygosporum TaxID=133381 RepID=A0A2T9ZLK6_9FUNG|nr:hypothetical protein BB560_000032 [Smittium megazygosporum]
MILEINLLIIAFAVGYFARHLELLNIQKLQYSVSEYLLNSSSEKRFIITVSFILLLVLLFIWPFERIAEFESQNSLDLLQEKTSNEEEAFKYKSLFFIFCSAYYIRWVLNKKYIVVSNVIKIQDVILIKSKQSVWKNYNIPKPKVIGIMCGIKYGNSGHWADFKKPINSPAWICVCPCRETCVIKTVMIGDKRFFNNIVFVVYDQFTLDSGRFYTSIPLDYLKSENEASLDQHKNSDSISTINFASISSDLMNDNQNLNSGLENFDLGLPLLNVKYLLEKLKPLLYAEIFGYRVLEISRIAQQIQVKLQVLVFCDEQFSKSRKNILELDSKRFQDNLKGKRVNPLRNRIDSYRYNLDQLLLGTILFTLLTYLFPTIIVYYISLLNRRLLVLVFQNALEIIISCINTAPVYLFFARIFDQLKFPCGIYFDMYSDKSFSPLILTKPVTTKHFEYTNINDSADSDELHSQGYGNNSENNINNRKLSNSDISPRSIKKIPTDSSGFLESNVTERSSFDSFAGSEEFSKLERKLDDSEALGVIWDDFNYLNNLVSLQGLGGDENGHTDFRFRESPFNLENERFGNTLNNKKSFLYDELLSGNSVGQRKHNFHNRNDDHRNIFELVDDSRYLRKANCLALKQADNDSQRKAAQGGVLISAGRIRAQKDISELDLPDTIKVEFDSTEIMNFKVTISPDQGYYKGGHFKFEITIPENYPHDPPKARLRQLIFHPNIDEKGNVCLNILREDWNPVLNINAVLFGLQLLLLEPTPVDPLNLAAASMLNHDQSKFQNTVTNCMMGGFLEGVKKKLFSNYNRDLSYKNENENQHTTLNPRLTNFTESESKNLGLGAAFTVDPQLATKKFRYPPCAVPIAEDWEDVSFETIFSDTGSQKNTNSFSNSEHSINRISTDLQPNSSLSLEKSRNLPSTSTSLPNSTISSSSREIKTPNTSTSSSNYLESPFNGLYSDKPTLSLNNSTGNQTDASFYINPRKGNSKQELSVPNSDTAVSTVYPKGKTIQSNSIDDSGAAFVKNKEISATGDLESNHTLEFDTDLSKNVRVNFNPSNLDSNEDSSSVLLPYNSDYISTLKSDKNARADSGNQVAKQSLKNKRKSKGSSSPISDSESILVRALEDPGETLLSKLSQPTSPVLSSNFTPLQLPIVSTDSQSHQPQAPQTMLGKLMIKNARNLTYPENPLLDSKVDNSLIELFNEDITSDVPDITNNDITVSNLEYSGMVKANPVSIDPAIESNLEDFDEFQENNIEIITKEPVGTLAKQPVVSIMDSTLDSVEVTKSVAIEQETAYTTRSTTTKKAPRPKKKRVTKKRK